MRTRQVTNAIRLIIDVGLQWLAGKRCSRTRSVGRMAGQWRLRRQEVRQSEGATRASRREAADSGKEAASSWWSRSAQSMRLVVCDHLAS